MKLIMQHPHPKACVLACIAMVEGVNLETVIALAGDPGQPNYDTRLKIAKHFGRQYGYMSECGVPIQFWGEGNLMDMMRAHETLLVSVNSITDPNFSHAAVIHQRQLYDPHYGMNPTWEWDKVLSRAYCVQPKVAHGG